MDIKDRFKMIMEREKLTAGAFAESIGVAQATISHILSSRNKYPSLDVILRLHQRYNDINLDWLLTGEGSMSSDVSNSANTASPAYPLFADTPENSGIDMDSEKKREEIPLEKPVFAADRPEKQKVIYVEKPLRKITEIRIFFDDNTYETFKPA